MTVTRSRPAQPRAGALIGGLAVAAALTLSGPAGAASADPDWPCIQGEVPEISPGMVWAGPPIDELESDWRDDYKVAQLAGTIAARRVDMEDAKERIAEFAEAQGEDRNTKLTELFAGVLHRINVERSQIMDGIKRYARHQKKLADKIEQTQETWNAMPSETEEQQAARAEVEQQLVWDTRVYDERERSLTYVCEQPVLLEQRAFALGRAIMNELER
jgi:hypothetical protein